jgi:enoyl-[acyl-carrier-protein] reductase (NADH)
LLDALPLRYLGSVDDIGAAAVYLSSELGKYVTGTILDVDGGYQIGDATIDCLSSSKKA